MYSFLVVDNIDGLSDCSADNIPSDFSSVYEDLIGNNPIIVEDYHYSVLKMSHPFNETTLLSDTIDFDTAMFRTTTALTMEFEDISSDREVFVVSGYDNYTTLMGIFKNIYILSEKGSYVSSEWVGFKVEDSIVITENENYVLRKVVINED